MDGLRKQLARQPMPPMRSGYGDIFNFPFRAEPANHKETENQGILCDDKSEPVGAADRDVVLGWRPVRGSRRLAIEGDERRDIEDGSEADRQSRNR